MERFAAITESIILDISWEINKVGDYRMMPDTLSGKKTGEKWLILDISD